MVGCFVFFDKLSYPAFVNRIYDGNKVSNAVAIYRIAHLNLGAQLVTLSHCHIAHIISKTRYLHIPGIIKSGGNTCPDCYLFNNLRIFPVTNHYLTVQPHPRSYKPEFPVAVSRLVQIHEIHVNGIPGDIPVKLCVEVKKGLAQYRKSLCPHFCRRKCMHPCYQSYTPAVVTGVRAQFKNGFRGGKNRLEDYLYRYRGRIVKSLRYCP